MSASTTKQQTLLSTRSPLLAFQVLVRAMPTICLFRLVLRSRIRHWLALFSPTLSVRYETPPLLYNWPTLQNPSSPANSSWNQNWSSFFALQIHLYYVGSDLNSKHLREYVYTSSAGWKDGSLNSQGWTVGYGASLLYTIMAPGTTASGSYRVGFPCDGYPSPLCEGVHTTSGWTWNPY